ncbi:MAG: tetratricopeptide repeat protein [Planctomycetota bacterium]|nr:MAG: tetratricopeptide repeat protein [Planctomycetota bacterium]
MSGKLQTVRRKIRSILHEEDTRVIELDRVMKVADNLEIALEAAKAESDSEKDKVHKAILSGLVAKIHLEMSDFDDAKEVALKIAEAKGIPDPIKAYAYHVVASVYQRWEDYSRAEALCKKALSLTEEKDDDVLAYIFNIIGMVNYYTERFSLSLEYFYLYRQISEKIGSKPLLIGALNNISISLIHLGREDEVTSHLLKAKEIAMSLGEKLRLGYVQNSLGGHYLSMGFHEKALPETLASLRLFEEVGHKRMYADCHIDLARICCHQGKLEEAEKHAEKALSFAEESAQKTNFPIINMVLGDIYSARDDRLAETYYTKSIEQFKELRPDGKAGGIEFAMLELGKYLLSQGEKSGAAYLYKAAALLEKRHPRIRIRKARAEIQKLLLTLPEDFIPPAAEPADRMESDTTIPLKILEITKAINSETEMSKVLLRAIDMALEISGAERGFIVLVEGDNRNFAVKSNFTSEVKSDVNYPVIHEIVTKVISDRTVFTTGNLRQSEILARVPAGAPTSLKGIFAFPLQIKDKVIGAVYLDSRYAVVDLSQHEISFMMTLMEQIALIVDKARLYERVHVLSERLGEELEETRSDLAKKQRELEQRYSYQSIIGKSAPMQKLFQLLDIVAEADLPVYIYGESGTGKELVAKAIHYNGPRRKKHFVAQNCAAIPDNLLESELFGYEKGAFTGASATKKGLFEVASGGTFFLDEIGNMNITMQQKLLRVLQEKEVRRIGGKKQTKIDVRFISASNVDPRKLVEAGRLREDLFYRINVLMIELPTLRERKEDISLLFEYFWRKATNRRLQASLKQKAKLTKVLTDYHWPGNVRELENETYKLASLGKGRLNMNYLSEHVLSGSLNSQVQAGVSGFSIPDMEKSLIAAALKHSGGNQSQAARVLEMPRSTLRRKMEKYEIQIDALKILH